MLARLTGYRIFNTVTVRASRSAATMFYYPEISRPIMRNMELWRLIVKFRDQISGKMLSRAEKEIFYQDAQKVLEKVIYLLEKYTIPVTSTVQIAQVSCWRADYSLALTVAEAFEKVGPDGLKMIVEGTNINDELEILPAIQLFKVNIYPMFIDTVCGIGVYNECSLVLYNDRLESIDEIEFVVNFARSSATPFILILKEYNWKAMHDLIRTKLVEKLNLLVVDIGSGSDKGSITMEDLTFLTGTKVVVKGDKESDVIKNTTRIETAYFTEDELLLIGLNIDLVGLNVHLKELQKKYNPDDAKLMKERIVKIKNNQIALIKIGGVDKEDIGKRMGLAVDTLGRAEQAVLHGIIVGDGRCLLDIIQEVSKSYYFTSKRNNGGAIVIEAMKHFYNLVYQSESSCYYKLSTEKSGLVPKFFGYDTTTKQYVNLISEGIFDPKSYFAQSFLFAKQKCNAYEKDLIGKGLEEYNV